MIAGGLQHVDAEFKSFGFRVSLLGRKFGN